VEAVTARQLLARTARAQAEQRAPSLVAGVVRNGSLAWWAGRGRIDGRADGERPTDDTQYRLGSITKTLTAILVLRLRSEGLLSLDDPLDRHVPGSPLGGRTIAQLLSQSGGVRAETGGPWWERSPGGSWDELVGGLDPAEVAPFPAGRRFHYSNLGFGALGEVVARHRGRPWFDALRAEVLEPLGMTRTSARPAPPVAVGLAVHPWAPLVHTEPEHDSGAMAPAGQTWSTARDLARLGAFLMGDTGEVLSRDDLQEMCTPGPSTGEGTEAYGLGLTVERCDGRVRVGHTGSMPGFLAALEVEPAQRAGALMLTNTTGGFDGGLVPDLLDIVRTYEPHVCDEWVAGAADATATALTGVWYWGPTPFSLTVEGELLRLAALGTLGRAARFRSRGDGTWVGLEGYYAGEVLRVGEGGRHLDIATFVFTREPYDPAAPIPGGADPRGWHTP
jgi:CubicO group peptidase (beta-lactamase class C family)